MLTPTFSNTRPPRITDISPPPASEPSSEVRVVDLTLNRPGAFSAKGPVVWLSSSASKAATIWSRKSRNHALARAFWSSIMSVIGGPPATGLAYAKRPRR